jgi:2-oxo-3-hexenedioate decarboxylase
MVVSQEIDPRVRALLDAEANRTEINRIDPNGELTEEEAYRLQFQFCDYKVSQGDTVIGMKTGLTSRAKQQTMGIHQPILGVILDSMAIPEGTIVDTGKLIHPRAEPEVAFLIGRDLSGPVTAAQVAAACESVFPAIEILDSRFENFKFGLGDVIADNTSASGVVFGSVSRRPTDIDLRLAGFVYTKNGEIEATATGAAILGNPWEALAWLARRSESLGRPLRAGHLVLAGSPVDAVFVHPGDSVRIEIAGLGSLTVNFG